MRRLETLGFWQELIELKDELSLRELAARFNVTPGAISAALKRTGVTRLPAPPGPRSARKRLATLPSDGVGGHETVADGLGSSRSRPGSKDPLIYAHYDTLGKVPDAEVARRAGVSVRTIASFRARHDIGGYKGPRRKPLTGRRKRSKIDPFVNLLGQVPDRVVAEKAKVSLNAVRNYRLKMGIQAAGRRGRIGQPLALPATAQFGDGASHAWRVFAGRDGENIEGIVIAQDLNEASASAVKGLSGAVVTRIEWVGALL